MRIDRVSYAKLFNLGNYENERIELEAVLQDGEDWAEAVEDVKNKVELLGLEYARDRGADREAAYNEYGAKARLDRINADIVAAEVRWKKAIELRQKHGLNTEDLTGGDDIPF